MPLSQQHSGTRSSDCKTASAIGDGLWLIPHCVEDAAGNRDDAHDQQGASKVVSNGRCGRTGEILRQAVRTCRLTETDSPHFVLCRNFATELFRRVALNVELPMNWTGDQHGA